MQLTELRSPTSRTEGESIRRDWGAPDRMIAESEFCHRRRIKQIAAVENNRRGNFFFHHRKIDIGKFRPFSRDHERFCTTNRIKRAFITARALDMRNFAGSL